MGVEYQMAALQAVAAQQIGGDILHRPCGSSWTGVQGADTAKQSKVAERVLQWRWLIIDEISMVSSKLLAEVDTKLRSIIS